MTSERPAYRALLGALLGTTAYAVIRYNVLKGVPWAALPVYVLNKSLSWSAVVLFVVAAWRAAATRTAVWNQDHFRQAFALSTTHMLLTLTILDGTNYPVLFSGTNLTWAGGVSTLAGVLAMMAFVVWNRGGSGRAAGLLAIPVLTAVHLVPLGYANWTKPGTWPGSLPPITLIAFLLCGAALWFLRSPPR